jgi:hypothetical protein
MQFELTNLCSDAEISSRVYGQMMQLMGTMHLPPFSDPAFKAQVFKTALDLMSKMTSVRLHKEAFLTRYEERLRYHQERDPNAHGEAFHIESEKELVGSLEAFLFQVKSSLDIATKLLIPCAGFGERRAETFGDGGAGVIKQLRRPHVVAKVSQERVDILIALIERHSNHWIRDVVDLRTRTIHREATQGLAFRFRRQAGDRPEVLIPTIPDADEPLTYPKFLVIVERLLFDFCRDFVAVSLFLSAPAMCVLQEMPVAEAVSRWNMQGAEHIRWQFGVRL